MAEAEWTFVNTLQGLFAKGVRYSTVIDLGCADGHFFLNSYLQGLFPRVYRCTLMRTQLTNHPCAPFATRSAAIIVSPPSVTSTARSN